jgi:hypothetical protein
MIIKKFESFLKESDYNQVILYYAFDWDDNILNMPTVIHMEKLIDGEWVPTDVSTAEFAEVRSDVDNWRILNNNPDDAFSEFRDIGPRGETAFLEDMKSAISSNKLGPAWNDFIECLSNGSLFAIITARGHEPEAMRMGVEWIIDNVLSEEELYEMYNNLLKFAYLFKSEGDFDRILKGKPSDNELVKIYLDNCDYVGVSAPSRGGSPSNPEKAKEDALLDFKSKIDKFASSIGVKAKIGFSDDDLKNVKHIEDLIDNLHHEKFPNIIQYVVKGTKDPSNITKKVRTLESQSSWGGGAGDPMSSSIVPFSNFNTTVQGEVSGNLAFGGSENRQDTFGDRLKKQTKFINKLTKDVVKRKPIRKKKNPQ